MAYTAESTDDYIYIYDIESGSRTSTSYLFLNNRILDIESGEYYDVDIIDDDLVEYKEEMNNYPLTFYSWAQ